MPPIIGFFQTGGTRDSDINSAGREGDGVVYSQGHGLNMKNSAREALNDWIK